MNFKVPVVKVCILLLVLQFAAAVPAQKRKPVKKAPPRAVFLEDNSLKIPEIKDFAFVVEIDDSANATLGIQKTENSRVLADASSNKNLIDFFTAFRLLQMGKTPVKTQISPLDPIIIVKADDSLNFGQIVEVIKSLRVSPKQKIKLQIAENYYVAIPPPIDENEFPKPNPNYLLVALQDDSKILLNREEYGTFNNTAPLKEILDKVFKMRENTGIFRSGTNEVEKTVFVTAPDSVKFGDVIKLIQEIAGAGAAPIGLQIDVLEIKVVYK
ncbi:MAG TPA: hypothetical protein VGC97_11875 [Pyrinomonadaceae bacterium]|jgi:biopolymer transport protein ExbD